MAKHTAGPWKVFWGRGDRYPLSICGPVVNGIATKSIVTALGRKATEEADANARLIAAAPDLLAAMELYVAHFGDPLKCARNAIQKAHGESL